MHFAPGQAPANASSSSAEADAEEDGLKPLSDRLVMELTAHRTLGLRDALANDPDTAFLAVLHALVLQTFYRYATHHRSAERRVGKGWGRRGNIGGDPHLKKKNNKKKD